MTQLPALDRLGDNLEQAITRQQAALRRRRRRTRWLLAAATAIAVGVAIVVGLGPRAGPDSPPVGPLRVDPASAKVTVHKTAGFYEIRLANVLADPEAIREALRRRGLNLKIQFIPSSPSLVNKEVASYETPGGDRRVRWSYRQASSVEGDLVTVRVPLDYQGELGIAIGRRVRPGEHYESAAISAQLPGEALHCADVEGKRIREILPILQQRHLRARWHITTPTGLLRTPTGRFVPLEQVLDWWVDGTSPWAPGEVMISAVPEQPDLSGLSPDYLTRMRQGCPSD
jgi:hypothetical protein